jgi:hypothetical protein
MPSQAVRRRLMVSLPRLVDPAPLKRVIVCMSPRYQFLSEAVLKRLMLGSEMALLGKPAAWANSQLCFGS